MEEIWQWGLAWIEAIQRFRNPWLDSVMVGVTLIGTGEFYLLLVASLLWCGRWRLGVRLGFLMLVSAWINADLKNLLHHPRPIEFIPSLRVVYTTGYGLASGHAQDAVVAWGYLAWQSRRKRHWGTALLLILLISFSRVYLGVHFPTDIMAGWGIGLILLLVAVCFDRTVEKWLRESSRRRLFLLSMLVPLGLFLLYPFPVAARVTGTLAGFGTGFLVTGNVSHEDGTGLRGQLLKLLVGIPILAGLLAAVRFGFEPGWAGHTGWMRETMLFLLSSLSGLWITLGAPWLFRRLKLMPRVALRK